MFEEEEWEPVVEWPVMGVVKLALHHPKAKVVILEYKNHCVHIVRSDTRENADICLQVFKNQYVVIVEGGIREIVRYSLVYALLAETWATELNNVHTVMMLVELPQSLLCKGRSLSRLIVERKERVVLQ